MEALGCLLSGLMVLAIVAGIDALIAFVIHWALNSFTQLQMTSTPLLTRLFLTMTRSIKRLWNIVFDGSSVLIMRRKMLMR